MTNFVIYGKEKNKAVNLNSQLENSAVNIVSKWMIIIKP